jgi:hypothetical protein
MKISIKLIVLFGFLTLPFLSVAQVTNTGTIDTTDVKKVGKLSIGGYIDVYDCYFIGATDQDGNRPYSFHNTRNNEITVNLAFLDIKYSSSRVRARIVPGFGTYVNANYAAEPGVMKNFMEASVGVRIFEKKQIWLEAGVIGSPYTNESYISKDHLMYTRSLAAEYTPYYLSGAKLSVPLSSKITSYFYLLNGWQVIQDNNDQKAFGTQIEYRPTDNLLLNWNTFLGDERSKDNPNNRMRYFTDFYAIYNPTKKLSFTSCVYVGVQERISSTNNKTSFAWWQANLIGSWKFNEKISLAGRVEYFKDDANVIVNSFTGIKGFETLGLGTCLNVMFFGNAMFRLDARLYSSSKNIFFDQNQNLTTTTGLLTGNITVWF